MACSVCCEPFNMSSHKEVTCPKGCGFTSCKTCIRTYFKDLISEPHCMNCKVEWDNEFVVISLNKSYFNGEFKDNRKTVLLNLEKSRLPDTQHHAKVFMQEEQYKQQVAIIKEDTKRLKQLIIVNEQKIILLHNQLVTGAKDEKKVFIMKCQSSTCNGFLSSSYKCDLCSCFTCSKCYDIIEEGHECKPENVESVALVKKETKACPKCAVRIYKIDGCNQMWCVECQTAFDWVSGKIVNGPIHNPEYYDYLKKNGGVPRAPGDVLCGGIPAIHYIRSKLTYFSEPSFQERNEFITCNLFVIHQFVTHLHYMYMTLIQHNHYQDTLKQLRILYILNRLDEETFKEKIYREHKKNGRTEKRAQLLQMIDNVGTDLLQNYVLVFEQKNGAVLYTRTCQLIQDFNGIVCYFNEMRSKQNALFNETGGYIGITLNQKKIEIPGTIDVRDRMKYTY